MGVPKEADADPEFDTLAEWLLIDSEVPFLSSLLVLAPNAALLSPRSVCINAAGIVCALSGSCSAFYPLYVV